MDDQPNTNETDDVHAKLARAIEREAATREVLEVISQNRADDKPVFDMILKKAADLCGAFAAALAAGKEGDTHQRMAASYGVSPETIAVYDSGLVSMNPDISLAAKAIVTGKPVHVDDMAETDGYRSGVSHFKTVVDHSGIRTNLFVPLMAPTGGIGVLILFRKEVKPFTADEIALVETFAAQAIIAVENVGQFRELQTRLERERASGEVLKVISHSRDDELPVFDAILDNACKLCNAPLAGLILGTPGDSVQTLAAHKGMFAEAIELFETGQMRMDGSLSYAARSILEGRLIAFDDMGRSELYESGSPVVRSMVDESNIRSVLFVPLIKDGAAIGNLTLFRREISPFNQSEISLVETFAAQAVIAIENVRQFRELQTRLEREQATREVLQVISTSRDDDMPVFEAILNKASRLCGAQAAGLQMLTDAGTHIKLICNWGDSRGVIEPGWTANLDDVTILAKAIREARAVNIPDLKETERYKQGHPAMLQLVDGEGVRSWLVVPLLQNGVCFGTITLSRHQAKPFDPDEIALVETFAAQALIAIENARQFREIQTRLKRERASAEVLELISKSREDEAPVFEMILNRAATLCGAPMASLNIVDQDRKTGRLVAHWGDDLRLIEVGKTVWNLDGDDQFGELYTERSMRDGVVAQCVDLKDTERYRTGEPVRCEMVDVEGIRTFLAVPLMHGGQAIGNIALYRRDVFAFSDDQIALVETFAAQAVIAIENVRQFKALETLNAELGDRVEEQVDEIERMGLLKRFLPSAVADRVVSEGSEKLLASHRALLGVLFCDIRGFTAFCETAEPEETIEVLQSYHEEMGKLIAEHGAGVDTRAGDGIMVLFNDPLPCEDPAGDALRLSIAMRSRMQELCKSWRRHGHKRGFGVGISLGYATVGMVGSSGRYDYTASGTAVNLAARLCDQAADGEILLSPRAYTAVEDDFKAEAIGELALKGIHAPVAVFRVADLD